MSRIDPNVPNEAVIPVIEAPELFAEHPEAQFATGIIAVGNAIIPGSEEIFRGYGVLRAEVYAKQTRMIGTEHVKADGTEADEDDARSIHFAVVEHTGRPGDIDRKQRVVGALRLIVKDELHPEPLPVEGFFPEAFADKAAAIPSTEASRYICRHEDKEVQERLSRPLFTGAVSYIAVHGLRETYGVVEPPVQARLSRDMDLEVIADPKFVPEYDDDNLAFRVDIEKLAQDLGLTPDVLEAMRAQEGSFSYPRVSSRSTADAA